MKILASGPLREPSLRDGSRRWPSLPSGGHLFARLHALACACMLALACTMHHARCPLKLTTRPLYIYIAPCEAAFSCHFSSSHFFPFFFYSSRGLPDSSIGLLFITGCLKRPCRWLKWPSRYLLLPSLRIKLPPTCLMWPSACLKLPPACRKWLRACHKYPLAAFY